MRSAASLEIMNSISPELNWKSVTKGRRTRKAVARSFKSVSKEGIISPKRVGDFSGSDSDKIAVEKSEQPNSGKSEHVPIKKRRRIPRSASPKPSSLPASEGQDQLLHSDFASFTKLQLEGIDELAKAKSGKRLSDGTFFKQVEEENYSGDFSGIELLAAAASMEDSDDNNASKEDHVEDNSIRGSSDTSTVVTPAEVDLKCNESVKSLSTTTPSGDSANCLPVLKKCNAASQSSSGTMNVGTSPTCISSIVDRRFWDLNTDMDEWSVPAEVAEMKCSEDDKISNPGFIGVESSIPKSEEKSGGTPDRTSCTESTGLQEHVLEPVKNSDSSVCRDTSSQATEKCVNKINSNTVTCSDADMKTKDVKMPGSQIVFSGKDAEDFRKSSESLGTCIKDEKSVGVSDSMVLNDDSFIAASAKTESHSQQDELLAKDKLVAKHEDNGLPNEVSEKMVLEDSCNSYSARAQYGRHVTSLGKMDVDTRPESPYEDGELRLSLSWEDNDVEAECVDYESDGRNGVDSDAGDDLRSDVVEGGCEVSHGTEGRISMMKRSVAGNKEKSDLAKHPLRRNFSRDESNRVETCGKKESDGGSGTTVEQGLEMVMNENNDARNRRDLTRRTDADDIKGLMGEYASRMVRGKLQSRTGGRSSLEAADAKDLFTQQFRSRRISGFRERDGSPEKYVGRYRPATFRNERDGVDQWSNWGSKGRFNTTHHETVEDRNGPRPRRNFTGEVAAEKYDGLDFHEQRQPADYLSRGLHRHIVRRSPVEREAGFNTHKRELPTHRYTNFRGRGRGHYPRNASRDFGEDYEPRPHSGAAPARFSRMPRRERSFSPDPVRDAHVPFARRRSRSRSKSRSPRPWHSYRDGNFNRRPSGSPEFRSEARVERVRAPFHKPNFASEYREGYMSPPRGRFSPQRNSRWVDGPSFGENHFKRRRSPTGVFRNNNQNFNSVNSSGRVKSDEYFRPMNRPRRPAFMDNDGRESKFDTNYDDRKLEDREEMRRVKPREDGGNFRRFHHDMINDFETNDSNNEEVIRRPAPVDLPQVQSVREDKKEFEI